MDEKTCIGCGKTFQTQNVLKKRCKPGCGLNRNKARSTKAKARKDERALYFRCGLPRKIWTDSTGHCKHCRQLARAKRQIERYNAVHQQEWYRAKIEQLNALTKTTKPPV